MTLGTFERVVLTFQQRHMVQSDKAICGSARAWAGEGGREVGW